MIKVLVHTRHFWTRNRVAAVILFMCNWNTPPFVVKTGRRILRSQFQGCIWYLTLLPPPFYDHAEHVAHLKVMALPLIVSSIVRTLYIVSWLPFLFWFGFSVDLFLFFPASLQTVSSGDCCFLDIMGSSWCFFVGNAGFFHYCTFLLSCYMLFLPR